MASNIDPVQSLLAGLKGATQESFCKFSRVS